MGPCVPFSFLNELGSHVKWFGALALVLTILVSDGFWVRAVGLSVCVVTRCYQSVLKSPRISAMLFFHRLFYEGRNPRRLWWQH